MKDFYTESVESVFIKIINYRSIITATLFVWGLSFLSRIFQAYGDVTITGEGLQMLTYFLHSWALSSEGSLACQTYYDTGHPFIMVISDDP